jgi:hypothetical protein
VALVHKGELTAGTGSGDDTSLLPDTAMNGHASVIWMFGIAALLLGAGVTAVRVRTSTH